MFCLLEMRYYVCGLCFHFHCVCVCVCVCVFAQGGVVHVCVGGVLTATEIETAESADDRESHVIITRLSGDLRLLSAVNLATNQQKSTLHLQTVKKH